jgi:hypothetical protein
MSTAQVPGEAERKKFVEKLNQFRCSLDASEQQMLDALVQAARQAHTQDDVAAYWFTASTGPSSDVWSVYSGTATYGGQRASGY